MVIELRFFKKKKNNKKMKNMDKMWKALFEILCMSYITDQPILYTGYFSHILHIKSDKLKVKMNKILINVDHSNLYIHSTTVLCD